MARNGLPTDCLILSQRSEVLPDVHKIIPMFYGFQFGIFKQFSLSLIFWLCDPKIDSKVLVYNNNTPLAF